MPLDADRRRNQAVTTQGPGGGPRSSSAMQASFFFCHADSGVPAGAPETRGRRTALTAKPARRIPGDRPEPAMRWAEAGRARTRDGGRTERRTRNMGVEQFSQPPYEVTGSSLIRQRVRIVEPRIQRVHPGRRWWGTSFAG